MPNDLTDMTDHTAFELPLVQSDPKPFIMFYMKEITFFALLLVLASSPTTSINVDGPTKRIYCERMEARGFNIGSCHAEAVTFDNKLCLKVRTIVTDTVKDG